VETFFADLGTVYPHFDGTAYARASLLRRRTGSALRRIMLILEYLLHPVSLARLGGRSGLTEEIQET
jgi:uncharacterized protein (DUF934 family)